MFSEMYEDYKLGIDRIGELYLSSMESTDKPRGPDGFWCVEETFQIFEKTIKKDEELF